MLRGRVLVWRRISVESMSVNAGGGIGGLLVTEDGEPSCPPTPLVSRTGLNIFTTTKERAGGWQG